MKKKTFIFASFALLFLMAQRSNARFAVERHNFSVSDSVKPDAIRSDSLANDSLSHDSVGVNRKNQPLEAPVEYTANDSIVYEAGKGFAHLYGKSKVSYQNITLEADQISMNIDSSTVFAQGMPDSLGVMNGLPVFTDGDTPYNAETMSYNFKTKRGYITNVDTKQGDGFLTSERAKKGSNDELYVEHAKYTTCDEKHPHFYLALSRAKVRPGKDMVSGPAWLVVEDVTLPLAVPFFYFPFSSKYSSGFIMPTYGDESTRGFYLRDGGYYFAISDRMDLKLLGDIYTQGSWGLKASSNYVKRYRYSGSFNASYMKTKSGDKGIDQTESTDFQINWSHRQDAKANPKIGFSASVRFNTSSYNANSLSARYNLAEYSSNTKASSISLNLNDLWGTGATLSLTSTLSQNTRDSSMQVSLPGVDFRIPKFYPFKRKKAAGSARWYEKIGINYNMQMANSISTKEDKLLHSSFAKDWKNGMNHQLSTDMSFSLLKYINVSPQVSYHERWYTYKVEQKYNKDKGVVERDTITGFNRVYDYSTGISANTTLYGFYVPSRKLFGDKVVAIRHVLTPQVSYSYTPDFSDKRFGVYGTYKDANGNDVQYNYYEGALYGAPGSGLSSSMNFSIGNNVEMKIRSDKDSTGYKKISLIDNLGVSMGYNFAATTRKWSDMTVNLRLKLSKSYTFSTTAVFATYAYDDNGDLSNRTEWSYGRFGRYQGMSQSISYTLNNEKLAKLFGFGKKDKEQESTENKADDANEDGEEKNVVRKDKHKEDTTDKDGYMAFKLPWSLSFSYGVSLAEDHTKSKFNVRTHRYPYKLTHTLNFSGNVGISSNWSFSFSSGYDFNNHRISATTCSIGRSMHCFDMSGSFVVGPYTSYNISLRANASELADALKYEKKSSMSSTLDWY